MATDEALQMIGTKAGVVTKLKEKALAVDPDHKVHNVHCIICGEMLCSKTLKMDNVINVAVQTVNFMHPRALNHRQSKFLQEENEDTHGLPDHLDIC